MAPHPASAYNNDRGELYVLAYRRTIDAPADVCLNVNILNVDIDVHLTPGQARLLIESLLTVARVVDGTQ